MNYKELLEPHRTLLFQLVESYREYGKSSGVIPFSVTRLGVGLVLFPGGGDAERRFGNYTLVNLRSLEKEGYINCLVLEHHMPSITLTKQASDYYDHIQKPRWRRSMIDVWDKTEKYWLSLIFGVLGGILIGLLGW